MRNTELSSYIISHPDILGGVPVFAGTRVPVSILFEYLQSNNLDSFFEGYPQVSRQAVNAALKLAAQKFSVKPRRASNEGTAG